MTLKRLVVLTVALPLLLAAKPQPQGTFTLTNTDPVTFTAETSHIGRRDHVWVSTSCFSDTGERTYYGEEFERDGFYVMDDTVWVVWTPGAVAEGTCRAFLIFRDESTPGEVILDDSGWFEAP
jgi:hypothetical protein